MKGHGREVTFGRSLVWKWRGREGVEGGKEDGGSCTALAARIQHFPANRCSTSLPPHERSKSKARRKTLESFLLSLQMRPQAKVPPTQSIYPSMRIVPHEAAPPPSPRMTSRRFPPRLEAFHGKKPLQAMDRSCFSAKTHTIPCLSLFPSPAISLGPPAPHLFCRLALRALARRSIVGHRPAFNHSTRPPSSTSVHATKPLKTKTATDVCCQ